MFRLLPSFALSGLWKFISRYEGWYALVNALDEDQLDKLREVAVWILRCNGPQFDPSPEEHLQANRKGKTLYTFPFAMQRNC